MFAIFIRLLLIFCAIVLQFSILSMGVYTLQSPSILLVLALAWTMILGFSHASAWLVVLGIVTDLYLGHPVGYSVIIFISIGYGMSFLSRRYLVEHRLWSSFILGIFIIIAFFLNVIASQLLLQQSLPDLVALWSAAVVREVLFVVLADALLFWIVYRILQVLERYLSFYEQKIQPKNYA